MKKEPVEIKVPYENLMDEILDVNGQEYVCGYSSSVKGHDYIHIEHRIPPTEKCPENKKGCRAKWVGYLYGNFGCGKVRSLYRCKHGEVGYFLVERIENNL